MHTVHQMYAESNVTSCICHGLGICTLTNPSVGDVIYPLHVHQRRYDMRASI